MLNFSKSTLFFLFKNLALVPIMMQTAVKEVIFTGSEDPPVFTCLSPLINVLIKHLVLQPRGTPTRTPNKVLVHKG